MSSAALVYRPGRTRMAFTMVWETGQGDRDIDLLVLGWAPRASFVRALASACALCLWVDEGGRLEQGAWCVCGVWWWVVGVGVVGAIQGRGALHFLPTFSATLLFLRLPPPSFFAHTHPSSPEPPPLLTQRTFAPSTTAGGARPEDAKHEWRRRKTRRRDVALAAMELAPSLYLLLLLLLLLPPS